jgi:hypothetical protein
MFEVVDQGPAGVVRIGRVMRRAAGASIVGRLASEWGLFDGTTHVWAKLPLR